MARGRWVVAALAVVALGAAGCSAGGPAGGGDPRDVLVAGAEPLVAGGSARARATFSMPGGQGSDVASEGVVSWRGAGGSTGELTLPSITGGGQRSRALFTEDAMYIDTGAFGGFSGAVPGLAGKQWLKQSYADVEREYGPIGKVLTAAIDQTNPVRSAALLVQSPDLREVGEEQVNGVATTHYAGTIRFTDAVEDLRLGLDRQVLDELRREIAADGLTDAQQYDLWVDDQGRPVRAQGRVDDPVGPESYSVDYSDYGPPRTVQAPPADQVVDKGQLMSGLGSFPD